MFDLVVVLVFVSFVFLLVGDVLGLCWVVGCLLYVFGDVFL